MAYTRWGEGDLYIYPVIGGDPHSTCVSCPLMPAREGSMWRDSFNAKTADEMLAHIREHTAAGHDAGDAESELLDEMRGDA